jgi:O-antigen/teichoic acid export membrane protein
LSATLGTTIGGRRGLAQRLVRGGMWALVGRSLALPASLITAMLLARLLSPTEVGAYFLAMSLIAIGAFFAQIGMARPVVKLVATALATERPEAARHTVKVAIATTVAGGAGLALLIAGAPGSWLTGLLKDGRLLGEVLPLLALLVIAYALIDLMAEALRGFQDLRAASLLGEGLAPRVLLTVVLAVLWATSTPLDLPAVLQLALVNAALVLLLAMAVLYRRLAALGRYGTRFSTAEILNHGPPFLLVRLNVFLVAGADLWILGMFRGAEEVAIYGIASRTAFLVGVPLLLAGAPLAPVIAELHSGQDRARLQAALTTSSTLSVLLSSLLLGAFALFGQQLLTLAFGPAYASSFAILMILGLGRLASAGCGSAATVLTMTGNQREVLVVGVLAALLTFGALILTAPLFGTIGVAVVIALSLALCNGSLALVVRWRLGLSTWATLDPARVLPMLRDLRRAVRPLA